MKKHAIFDFSGSAVLVTGASGGLGAAIARAFAVAGADLFLHYRSGLERAETLRLGLPRPERHRLLRAEGEDEASVAAAMAEMGAALEADLRAGHGAGRLLVLVNNAGTYPSSPIDEIDARGFRAVMDASLTSAHLFSRAALPLMASGSSIINIASVEGLRPALGHAHYGAAKAALIQYTKSEALELGRRGIRANSVSPGLVAREGLAEVWPEGYRRWVSVSPSGRAGEGSEVAAACLFLASDAASWINGVNLIVDGGASTVAPQDPGLEF